MLHAHKCRIMFFIAVELDAFAVVSVYDEGIANVLLLFLSNGAELFLNVVISGRTETLHNAQPNPSQVGNAYIIVDARNAPCVAFFMVEHKEWASSVGFYYVRIGYHIPILCVVRKHSVSGVAQTFVCLFTMFATAMGKVGIQLVVFFQGHNVYVLMRV